MGVFHAAKADDTKAAKADDTKCATPTHVDRLDAKLDECHGRCFGFEQERSEWLPPRVITKCSKEARPGYHSMTASEYEDDEIVLKAKVRVLGALLKRAQRCVIYSGAGLSTGAGIGDYASQSEESASGTAPPPRANFLSEIQSRGGVPSAGPAAPPLRSPLCAQPTLSHKVLVALHRAGHVHRWINQNHDGLPQKAGIPQEAINEIHGAWHAPDNPVVPMSGSLREDLFADLRDCEQNADLAIAVGTSLCGMNADRVVTSAAERAAARQSGSLGSVIIGLQQTVQDCHATLRIFGRCDDVFKLLAEELEFNDLPSWAAGEYFVPEVLKGRAEEEYIFQNLAYDAAGNRSTESAKLVWDLRDDAELVIARGMHAGAKGVVDGFDREGNVRCRFILKPQKGKLRAPVPLLLGRWWIQAAVDGAVATLPVVNLPDESDMQPAAQYIRELAETYAKP
eukprot:TRINITY_DN8894_c0_g1_i1.p1 TRINITY_DN8894_c0_g1~~TRINITY_DN8894_c0_g1_i1.p1  ORF type:complete len:454 (-),score=101.96 TRINITY_DN8894_c0_g1_i1:166-1527(-)